MNQLPQNFNPYDPDVRYVAADFVRYLDQNYVNLRDNSAVNEAWGRFSNMAAGGAEYSRASGLVGEPNSNYSIYNNGPFSWQEDEVMAQLVQPQSKLAQWIPTTAIANNEKNEVVAHIEWIAPDGWDGEAYSTLMAGLDITDCTYGPGTKWNGFEYQMSGGKFSKETKTFNRYDDLALFLDYKRSPRFKLRGPQTNLRIENDVEYMISILGIDFQNHLNWVLSFGQLSNQPQMEWDGLDTILSVGYVSARLVPGSSGVPSGWADPIVIDGTTIATIAGLVNKLQVIVNNLRERASKRGLSISDGDMAIRMPLLLWRRVAQYMAVNGYLGGVSRTEIPSDANARYNEMMRNPAFEVDGRFVIVLIDDDIAVRSGNLVTTDIQVLTRKLSGMNILEQQYVDWNTLNLPTGLEPETTWEGMELGLGGIVRYGWIEENKACFKFFMQMGGRLVSRSQPNQAVIENFSFSIDTNDIIEGSTYTNSYYANFGTPGSIGNGAI